MGSGATKASQNDVFDASGKVLDFRTYRPAALACMQHYPYPINDLASSLECFFAAVDAAVEESAHIAAAAAVATDAKKFSAAAAAGVVHLAADVHKRLLVVRQRQMMAQRRQWLNWAKRLPGMAEGYFASLPSLAWPELRKMEVQLLDYQRRHAVDERVSSSSSSESSPDSDEDEEERIRRWKVRAEKRKAKPSRKAASIGMQIRKAALVQAGAVDVRVELLYRQDVIPGADAQSVLEALEDRQKDEFSDEDDVEAFAEGDDADAAAAGGGHGVDSGATSSNAVVPVRRLLSSSHHHRTSLHSAATSLWWWCWERDNPALALSKHRCTLREIFTLHKDDVASFARSFDGEVAFGYFAVVQRLLRDRQSHAVLRTMVNLASRRLSTLDFALLAYAAQPTSPFTFWHIAAAMRQTNTEKCVLSNGVWTMREIAEHAVEKY